VCRAQTAEAVTLDRTGETFTGRDACNVYPLAGSEMSSRQFSADFQQTVFTNAELADFLARLDFRFRKVAQHRFRYCLGAAWTGSQLNGGVAVFFLCLHSCDKAAVNVQYADRHHLAVITEDACHADFLY
jgi:hypothetical protein